MHNRLTHDALHVFRKANQQGQLPMRSPPYNHHLAVIIPALNESQTIGALLSQLPMEIEGVARITAIVVDDGSSDDTADIAQAAGAIVVRHPRNFGLASAFRTGIRASLQISASLAVSIDADMQFSPGDIPDLIKPIIDGEADFVAADRFSNGGRPKHMSRLKYYGNQAMTGVINLITGNSFRDVSSGFRAYSREALLHINVQSAFTYTQESFIELASKELAITQVPTSVRYYPERRSRVVSNVARYGVRTLLTIARTTRDYAPLTFFGIASLALAIPGVLLGLFILAHYLATGSFSPYIFVAFSSVYLFTLGIALFALGLVADMLRGTRANQERLLYFAKRSTYDNPDSEAHHRDTLTDCPDR